MTRASLAATALVFVAPALVAACAGSDRAAAPPAPPAAQLAPPPPPPPVTTTLTGVETALMDRSQLPGSDFYRYANGDWMRATVIPPDQNSVSSFAEVTLRVEAQTHAILEDATAGKLADSEKTPSAKQAADVYASFLDEAKVDELGLRPIAPALARIARIGDRRALAAELGGQMRADVDILNHTKLSTRRLFGMWVEQDLNDPRRQVPYLLQGGIGMPDRKYYLDSSPKMVKTRERYLQHLSTLLKLAGVAQPEAKARRVLELETKIAEVHASRSDTSDTRKGNNPWKREEFAARAPGMDWKTYFHAAGLDQQEDFVVWHPGAFAGVGALVTSVPLSTWKEYLTVQALDMAAPYLAKPFADEDFAFQLTELKGVPEMRARWKRALDAATHAVPDAVGRLYVGRHFRADDKRRMQEMVAGILDAFDRRIERLAWMAPETKARAREKLKALYVGVGYPDTWEDYAFEIRPDDLLGNMDRAELAKYRRSLAKLGKPADKKEWCMEAQLVNAVNLPVRNSLNFPAAILQPPFFRPGATAAIQLRRHRRGHRSRDQPQLRQRRRALRRARQVRELVDAGGPGALPGVVEGARRAVQRVPAVPRSRRERRADAEREHRRSRRAFGVARRLARLARRQAGAGGGRLLRRAAVLPRLWAELEDEDARGDLPPAPHRRRPRAR